MIYNYFSANNPFRNTVKEIEVSGKKYKYFDLSSLGSQYGK